MFIYFIVLSIASFITGLIYLAETLQYVNPKRQRDKLITISSFILGIIFAFLAEQGFWMLQERQLEYLIKTNQAGIKTELK